MEANLSSTISCKQEPPLYHRRAWLIKIINCLSIVILLILAFVPIEHVILNEEPKNININNDVPDNFAEPHYKTITLLRPWFKESIFWAGLLCFILLCIIRNTVLKNIPFSKKTFNLVLILLFLFSPIYRFYMNLSPWRICDQVTGPDNNKYSYMAWSFMMGGFSTLSKLENQTLFWQTFEVLQEKPKDLSAERSMIRPTDLVCDDSSRLYVTKSGYVLVMYSNKCRLAYDCNNKRAFGYRNIDELSPFVLIDSNTTMNQNDGQDVITMMKEACLSVEKGYELSPSYIKRPILEKALEHPNGEVRKLAQQLLDISEKPK